MRRRVGAQRRVGAHQAVHVRPVFVETRAEGGGDPRAGNVRAAAGEGLNFAVGAASVKAGNHRAGIAPRHFLNGDAGFRRVHATARVEVNQLRRVHEGQAGAAGEEHGAQALALGRGAIPGEGRVGGEGIEQAVHGNGQRFGDFLIARANGRENQAVVAALGGAGVGQQQKIRHLVVHAVAAAGRGEHDKPRPRRGGDQRAHAAEAVRVGHGAAAEFGNENAHKKSLQRWMELN